jgi:hypothetical protein
LLAQFLGLDLGVTLFAIASAIARPHTANEALVTVYSFCHASPPCSDLRFLASPLAANSH